MAKKEIKKEKIPGTGLQGMEALTPGGDLQAYINSAHSIGVLTPEEEKKLAEDLYYRNDLDAARKLVLAHLRFVIYIAKSYSGYGLSEADLIQEGNIGLMKAIRKFNPEMGVRVVSFAVHWVKAEIHEYVLKNWKIVKIATTKAQRKLFFNLRSKKKTLDWLTQEEAEKIAEDLNVEVKDVLHMENRLTSHDSAFDAPVGSDDEGNVLSPSQFLEDKSFSPEILVEAQEVADHNSQELSMALSGLDERSKDIIARRYLADEKETLHDLADEYNVSAERIRQIENGALKKLKAAMSNAA